ncbi:substrate-binding domain-containing protein [Adhaeretor mobilis]|uniref:D-ribose-binding periplasmic protein n=1 Tax=Adhaeretor mobilis TaxID=1930276 RepID=A0A517N1C7_9BACT|nr:substrate-binding domain-containing protein [Adhaeretor mobilis]QDT00936.1 D-ribose-binding periplasmic protein precursor [Adhaeretor mobilis]
MSAIRPWLWLLLLVSVGGAFWYRSTVPTKPESTKKQVTRAVFVTGGDSNFWKLTVLGAEAAAKAHNVELQVEMLTAAEQADEQLKLLAKIDHDAIDGCAVSPLDAEKQTPLLNSLAKDMHLVTFDSDASQSDRQYYVGTSNYNAGKFVGDMVRKALPEGGKVCVLIASLSKGNLQERIEGYEKSMQNAQADATETDPRWQTVAILTDDGDPAKAEQNVLQALQANEDLDCFVGLNGWQGPAILKGLADKDLLNKVKIVAFDEDPETLQGIVDGSVHATIAQDPFNYGYEAIRILACLQNNKTSELPSAKRGEINVNCEVIRQANVEEFKERLEKRLSPAGEQETPEEGESEATSSRTT